MKHKFLLFLFLVILFIILTALQAQNHVEKSYQTLHLIKTIPAPGPNCQGLTWDGQYLWVSDIVNDSIYQIDTADGRVIHKIPTTPTNHLFEGLAWDGEYLWASHYESFTLKNPRISKIDPVTGNVLANIIPFSSTCWPHGIAWDGQYLWVNDLNYKKIRKIDPYTGIGLDSIICPGNNGSVGLAWFNNYLFTGDFNTDSIYQINPITKKVVNQWLCPYTNPRDMEFDGEYFWFVAYEVAKIYKMRLIITELNDDDLGLNYEFVLYQNYPNPFNSSTKIRFEIPEAVSPLLGGARGGFVSLKVYDLLGNEVATLIDEYKSAGSYEVEFDAAQTNSRCSGVYFYQLKVGNFIQTKKMILLQ